MLFTFTPLTREEALALLEWRYTEPYTIYNLGPEHVEETLAELLDQRSPYYAARDERGELVGFINVGTSALVWDAGEPRVLIEQGQRVSALGLGLRPDLTGRGLGQPFVEAALSFIQQQFAPHQIRLFVLSWNERAIRVYERVGFQRVKNFTQTNRFGTLDFVEMSTAITAIM